MQEPGAAERRGSGWARRCAHPASLLLPLLSAACAALLLVRHNLYFDETIHLHVTWLLSRGLVPWRDFFFDAPLLSEILFSPLLRLLPEGGYLVLLFRGLAAALAAATALLLALRGRRAAGHWVFGAAPFLLLSASPEMGRYLVEFNANHPATVAAVAAFLLFAGDPSPGRVGWGAALSVLSVAFNPKFGPSLALGGAGFLAAACLSRREAAGRAVALGAAGAAGAAAAVWLLHALAGVPFPEAVRWGFLFRARHFAAFAGADNANLLGNAVVLLSGLWPAGLMVAAGLAGWVAGLRRGPWWSHLPEGGILAGVLLFAGATAADAEQYQLPVLVTLAFFAPRAANLLPGRGEEGARPGVAAGAPGWANAAWSLLAAAAAALLLLEGAGAVALPPRVRQVREDYREQGRTEQVATALDSVRRIDALLEAIPPGEAVVALWFQHPLFRRDLTGVVVDELSSFSLLMAPGEPARRFFDPSAFAEALRRRPPAYVAGFQLAANYPPDWIPVLESFLRATGGLYAEVPTRYGSALLRRDLWREGLADRLR